MKSDKNSTYIKLKEGLNVGDGIEIISSSGEGKGLIVDSISMDKDIAKIKNVKPAKTGDLVYKTLDVDLNEKARKSFEKTDLDKKHPLYMEIEIAIGKPITLKVIDNGLEVVVRSEELAELARNVSLTKERVIEQMEKLGSTPYRLESIKASIEDGSMVRVSVLNNLRRDAIENLIESRSDFNKRLFVSREDMGQSINKLFTFPKNKQKRSRKISIKIDRVSQLDKLDLNKVDRIYLNFKTNIKDAIAKIKKYDVEIYIATEKIIENNDFVDLKTLFDSIIDDIDGVSVSNLGTLKFIKDNYNTHIHADYGLNIFNSQTVKLLLEHGVSSVTLSPELKLNQLEKISRNQILDYEVVGYGYLPVMVMKHCPMSVIKNCKSQDECSNCELKEGYGLLDRKDMIFDFKRNDNSTIIYNSQPILIPEHIKKIYNNQVDMVRLEFTKEDNIREIQDVYYDFANDKIDIDEVERKVDKLKTKEGITKGHFFRGVL